MNPFQSLISPVVPVYRGRRVVYQDETTIEPKKKRVRVSTYQKREIPYKGNGKGKLKIVAILDEAICGLTVLDVQRRSGLTVRYAQQVLYDLQQEGVVCSMREPGQNTTYKKVTA